MKILQVPLSEIRTDLAHLKQWPEAPAIQDGGPLVVVEHEGRYVLVDGFKRLAALRARGQEKAWIQVIAGDLRAAKAKLLTLNSARKTATLYEEILVVEELSEKDGMAEKAIARHLGRKLSWVRERLAMAERLGPEIRQLLAEGKLRIRVALKLAELPRALALRAAFAIQREGLPDKEAREFLGMLGTAEDPSRLLAHPREEMMRFLSPTVPEDPEIARLKRLREELQWLGELFSNPPADPRVSVELKRVAWAIGELAQEAGKLLDPPIGGGNGHDTRRDPHRSTEAGGDGATPALDRQAPQAPPQDRPEDPQGLQAAAPSPKAQAPGSLPGSGATAHRGWPQGGPHLPEAPAGRVLGGPDRGGEPDPLHPARAQAPGLLPVRDRSGIGGPDRLVPLQAEVGGPDALGPPVFDDPVLVPAPVSGGVPR